MNPNAKMLLLKIRKAKEDLLQLEKEYREICSCNDKIPGVDPQVDRYRKLYKTCDYHEVKFYRGTNA